MSPLLYIQFLKQSCALFNVLQHLLKMLKLKENTQKKGLEL